MLNVYFMKVGYSFTAGIPDVASVTQSVSVTGSYSHTWGKTESETKKWTTHDSCTAGPGIKAVCTFYVNKVGRLH